LAGLSYASSSKWAISLRGRKNLPVGSSISSWAGVPAIAVMLRSPFEIVLQDDLATEPRGQ
jgi:hypothetical protein